MLALSLAENTAAPAFLPRSRTLRDTRNNKSYALTIAIAIPIEQQLPAETATITAYTEVPRATKITRALARIHER